jgi:prephenate dehydrogenase
MAAREAFPDLYIHAIDEKEETLQYALRQNVVDRATPALPEALAENHLIVLGAHLPGNRQMLEALAPKVQGKDCLVMDLGSCKRQMLQLGEDLLPGQFIGGHPMAGREVSGIKNATSLLFAGKRFLMTPSETMQKSPLLERATTFVEGMNFHPSIINAEEHDRIMAYVSHFPQLYSILLTNLIARHEPGKLLSYHGGGIDDQLRLAASPYTMWGPVFQENADNMRQVLDEVIEILQEMKGHLEDPDMALWFRTSNQMHQAFHQLKRPEVTTPETRP